MLILFEAGFLSATDPAVKLPQVCYRLLSEWLEMQVTVRSKLWGHGRTGKAPALHLCQNVVPPRFMSGQSVRIFRRPWIRDLGSLVIADPRVDVSGMLATEFEHLRQFIQNKSFTNTAPMTEVDGQLQFRYLAAELSGDYRMKG